jgi:hypothetical protein
MYSLNMILEQQMNVDTIFVCMYVFMFVLSCKFVCMYV